MGSESLTNPLHLVGVLFELVFVVGILEILGMVFYSSFTAKADFDALMRGGTTPLKFVEFVLASPDRVVVAALLALVGFVLVFFVEDSSGAGVDDIE